MMVTDTSSLDASSAGLPRGIMLALAATLGIVAPILTALVVLGGIAAVAASGATLIGGANGESILEWAPPLAVWQWVVGGVIEFTMIAAAATAWWAAMTVWRGRLVPEHGALTARFYALGAGCAMLVATTVALWVHIRNWRDWHSVIAQHPEWGESPQQAQIPVGIGVALVIMVAIAVASVLVTRGRSVR